MGQIFDGSLSPGHLVLLIGALLIALGFELVNGFHDTANAVATVIYTKTLRPSLAVVLSGFFNFTGVFLGGIAVAMSIMKLLPVELLVSASSGLGLAMVLALLIAAIAWNLGTWYLGLPASSSHTMIGAILGVGLANSIWMSRSIDGVNWTKATEVGIALLISPMVGFALAALLLKLIALFVKDSRVHQAPKGDEPPPWWIRGVLVGTCCGVSFAHGSNDGQKGVGLIMLILTGMLPAGFAINLAARPEAMVRTREAAVAIERAIGPTQLACADGLERPVLLASTAPPAAVAQAAIDAQAAPDPRCDALSHVKEIESILAGRTTVSEISNEDRWRFRANLLWFDEALKKAALSPEQAAEIKVKRKQLAELIEYAPLWVLIAVAMALGIGTTIGWKRIVVTVGEKIGKSHLTYAQGASAEMVAMSTIGLSGLLGLPVSTTHVLSSGIAGTMVAKKSGIQGKTVRNIALAWLLTLPASMLLAGVLFTVFRMLLA